MGGREGTRAGRSDYDPAMAQRSHLWYALHTKPRQEWLVAEHLDRRGVETYLPQCTRRRRGRESLQAVFPCYLFARADSQPSDAWIPRWIPGLRGLVSFDGVPARVPETAIARVQEVVARLEAWGGFPKAQFQPGQRVRLKEGPLAGLEGIFEGPTGPAERVRILIRFLAAASRAIVPVGSLEPVADRPRPPRRTRGRGRLLAAYRNQPVAPSPKQPAVPCHSQPVAPYCNQPPRLS